MSKFVRLSNDEMSEVVGGLRFSEQSDEWLFEIAKKVWKEKHGGTWGGVL